MKIGEFAAQCGTRISVLRHYDKEGLLHPAYTDIYSGYRYYKAEQILTYHRIAALKKANFSLQEIKELIADSVTQAEISEIFSRKEKEFQQILKNLQEARYTMYKLHIVYEGNTAKVQYTPETAALEVCTLMEKELKASDYQRVSQYKITEEHISCEVVKLGMNRMVPEEELPFENDEDVVGKWEIVGIYAVKEDFYDNLFCVKDFYGGEQKYLYFLPEGQPYWAFSWTKGYLNTPYNNEYETEMIDDTLYMFVNLKEYEYSRGGEPTCMVLKKIDSKQYSAEEISKKDDIDKEYVADERVIGTWKAHSFLRYYWNPDDFCTTREPIEDLYFKQIDFYEDGKCKLTYEDAVFEGDDVVVWTRDYILRKWNWSACKYDIRSINGCEYMIVEWKSGDYRYGGYETNYYVFTKAE